MINNFATTSPKYRPFPIADLNMGMIAQLRLLTYITVNVAVYKVDLNKIYAITLQPVQEGPVFIPRGEDMYIPRHWITECRIKEDDGTVISAPYPTFED
jgi:hypothetical protein